VRARAELDPVASTVSSVLDTKVAEDGVIGAVIVTSAKVVTIVPLGSLVAADPLLVADGSSGPLGSELWLMGATDCL